MQEHNLDTGVKQSLGNNSISTAEMIQASPSPCQSSPNCKIKGVEHQTLNNRSSPAGSKYLSGMGTLDQEERTPVGENGNFHTPPDRPTDSNNVSISNIKFAVLAD